MNVNEIRGFHIELTNMCTLKCPGCARTRFIEQWPNHWKNHNLDVDDLLKFLDIDLSGKIIHLSGNYGDPIYHPFFLDILQELKNQKALLSITTNGSYKSKQWWEKVANLLSCDDHITFSVDGVPENFFKYRVNGDWNSIQQAMEVVSASECKSMWKYIVFEYNKDDINDAKTLCKKIGITEFRKVHSDRFDNQTDEFRPINVDLLGDRFSKQSQFKKIKDFSSSINPKCASQKEHFISADGYYSPCCYVADHRFYYKTEFGKNRSQYNIKDNTLTQILKKPGCLQFYSNLQDIPACKFNCPKT